MTVTDVDVALDYRRRLYAADDRVDRLRILSDAPLFTFWHDVREEVKKAADDIEALRARIRALEGEDA